MHYFRKSYYSLKDTNFFKGIGILLIVIHNYLHWQPGFNIENEDGFHKKNVLVFLDNLFPFVWTDTFSAIFGFLGHYGVQLFIFFSAYGLSVQFLKSNSRINYFRYLFKRLKKLYFLLGFAIVLFLIFNYLFTGNFYPFKKTLLYTFLLSTSLSNFSNNYLYSMFVGPFWFFGLMVQLYIVFPFLFKFIKKFSIYSTFSVCFILIYALYYVDLKSSFSLFGNIIGHLPEVILGIYFAQKGITKPSLLLLGLCSIGFALSQYFLWIFPLSFICITIILLYILEILKEKLNPFFTKTIQYIGEISMILFVVNGFFRLCPLFKIKDALLRGERIFLYLLLLFILSYFIYNMYIFLSKKLKI